MPHTELPYKLNAQKRTQKRTICSFAASRMKMHFFGRAGKTFRDTQAHRWGEVMQLILISRHDLKILSIYALPRAAVSAARPCNLTFHYRGIARTYQWDP